MHVTAHYLPVHLRLITHNIRYATERPFKGEELWPVRRPKFIKEFKFTARYSPGTFICLQEVLDGQLEDIMHDLGSEWGFIGVGRDDGAKAGEYSPIIYRKDVWDALDWRTIWLSETPKQPSKGWDAASTRILTVGVFSHWMSGRNLIVMNTHLDDQGKVARAQSAKLIIQEIRDSVGKCGQPGEVACPVFLAGDFNSETDDDAYRILNSKESPVTELYELLKKENKYGHFDTYTGFGGEESAKRIDFLFLSDTAQGEVKKFRAEGYAVLENRFDDGVCMSDHRAVVGDFVLC